MKRLTELYQLNLHGFNQGRKLYNEDEQFSETTVVRWGSEEEETSTDNSGHTELFFSLHVFDEKGNWDREALILEGYGP